MARRPRSSAGLSLSLLLVPGDPIPTSAGGASLSPLSLYCSARRASSDGASERRCWSSRRRAAAMAREGRSHSGLADVLQQGDGTTCGRSRYRKLADVVAEKAAAPEIGSC